jgi:hypothetical protein
VSAAAAATAATTTAAAATTAACLGKQKEREKTSTNMARSAVCGYNRRLQHFTRAGTNKLPEA